MKPAKEEPVCPKFAAYLAETQNANPAKRRCVRLDAYLRTCSRMLNETEICQLFNAVAVTFRRQYKFSERNVFGCCEVLC